MKYLFVPYNLALLAKEKGFNEMCFYHYNPNGVQIDKYCCANEETDNTVCLLEIISYKYDNDWVEAPLYQQLIDWLDSKNIHISIHPEFYKDGINWNWQVFEYDSNGKEDPISNRYSYTTNRSTPMYGDNGEYPTRILALEAAILEAFKLI